MDKDMASMLLGLVALAAVILFKDTAVLSIVSIIFSIVFGIMAFMSGGKKLYAIIGFAASGFTTVILLFNLIMN